MKTRFLDTIQSTRLIRLSILGLLLLVVPGCASLKDTARNTHSALMTITMFTELDDTDETEESAQLYQVEEEITAACEPLQTIIRLKVDGEDIPLMLLLDALLSVGDCNDTVDAAQQKLSAMNLPVNQF